MYTFCLRLLVGGCGNMHVSFFMTLSFFSLSLSLQSASVFLAVVSGDMELLWCVQKNKIMEKKNRPAMTHIKLVCHIIRLNVFIHTLYMCLSAKIF